MKKYLIGLCIVLICLGGGLGYWYTHRSTGEFRPYDAQKDYTWITKQFKDNWYLLMGSPDYDLDYALSTHSPNKHEPEYKGKMQILILYNTEHERVGLVTFYMMKTYEGRILFVEVDKNHRGKKYGTKLVSFAVDQLKKMGAKVVRLAVRIENTRAQKVYKDLGFEEVGYYCTVPGSEMYHYRLLIP